MKIASLSENIDLEKRIAITPDTAKKFKSLNFEISLPSNYGNHLGFSDNEYKDLGVNILGDDKEIVNKADVIVQLGLPSDEKLSYLTKGQNLIGVLNPFLNKVKIDTLIKKEINNFSLELLPRITRAQSMDILSSQANLAGYKAVLSHLLILKKQYL